MVSEAGAVIGVLFAIAFVAILIFLKIRYCDKKPVDDEDEYDKVEVQKVASDSAKARSQKSAKRNDISTLLFPEVSNPLFDVEKGNVMDTENDDDYQGETLEKVFTEGICKAGYLKKKSSGIRKDWLIRYFFIKDGKLFYVHEGEELVGRKHVNARQVANLMISTAKEVSDIEFQIISPGQRGSLTGGGIYELQGDNNEDMIDWVRVIRQQIEGALVSTLSGGRSAAMKGSASELFILGKTDIDELRIVNPYCADCGVGSPEWVSLNLCIMVCIACSGIHRKLGTHVSKIRSITLDKLSFNSLQLLLTIGNERSNAVWEAQLTSAELKITPESNMEEREVYITSKYVQRMYAFARDATMAQKVAHLVKSATDGDLIGIIAAIAAGADVNVRVDEGGNAAQEQEQNSSKTALHLACVGQHTLCVELLCQMNASTDSVDSTGFTALDIAIGLGYPDIQEILTAAGKRSNSPHREYETAVI